MSKNILTVNGVSKSFPGVQALNNVSFNLNKGEIHALIGANGAGKSTLIKILAGYLSPDSGEIILNGVTEQFKNAKDSINKGIVTVNQEIDVAEDLDVAQNIYLGAEGLTTKCRIINSKTLYSNAKKVLDSMQVTFDGREIVRKLSTADKQMILIAKALSKESKIMIFDEPTSALSQHEIEKLFVQIKAIKEKGVSIIYVSHHLDEIFRIADRITVLKDGEYVKTCWTKEISKGQLIELMLGKELTYDGKKCNYCREEVSMRVEKLSTIDSRVNDVSFQIRKGEILGLFGVIGSGRTELAKAIFTGANIAKGKIYLNEERVKIKNCASAIKNGIVYIPESRKEEGLLLGLSIKTNIIISILKKLSFARIINRKNSNIVTNKYIESLDIKTPNSAREVVYLSGGNQQKVVLSKWLATDSERFIFDEPTIGIDVGSKAEILKIMVDLARQGRAILFISSEAEELQKVCDRIIVMRHGRFIAEIDKKDCSNQKLLSHATGGNL